MGVGGAGAVAYSPPRAKPLGRRELVGFASSGESSVTFFPENERPN